MQRLEFVFGGKQRAFRRVLAVVAALVVTTGCSTARTRDRLKVVEAENIHLQQQYEVARQNADQARMAEDRLQGDLQQTRHEKQLAEMRARDADRAAAALEATTADTRRITGEITDLQAKLDRIKNTPPPAPVMLPPESPRVDPRQSRQAEALAQDLRGKLSRFGVSLPVEVRAARDGRQRVAIVLENSFKAGDDSLATNMDAVRAIVNLGKLINEAYPGSRVTVEGHTDSDPISKSGKRWRDNEHLSLARAEAVRTALTKAGVSAGSVTVVGHGARYPIAPGKSDRAKSRNRRVEIYVEPSA